MKLVEEIVWNDRDYKAEVDGELHIRKGNLKGKFTMPSETKPYVLDITYKHDVVNGNFLTFLGYIFLITSKNLKFKFFLF